MANTSHLAITLIEQSQAQKEVAANAAFVALDALLNTGAIDKDLTTPPVSPANGDVYIVPASATEVWSGKTNQITFFYQTWQFIVPREGVTIWLNDEDKHYTFDGTAWAASITSLQNLNLLGVNTSADVTNKLAVASAAILLNHIGTDMQVKINKNAAGNKAAFLFQNGFSGRAEFGLLGDDNFTLKVSPDGSTFFDALKMLASSGRSALKSNASGLAAAGTTQGTATAITKQTNEFTTVAASSGAILPSPEQGEFIFVANAGANTMNVYPAVGQSINALATNVAFTLAAGKNVAFWAATGSKWYANLTA